MLKRAGTGFLVDDGQRMWLVTCAHIITGLRESPATLDQFLVGRLELVGRSFGINLFDGGSQRFAAVINMTDGFLADVIATLLIGTEMSALIGYGSHSLSIVAPELGEPVTATGFPGTAETLIDATTLEARIDEIEGLSIRLSAPSSPGFSGSARE